jgi:type IV secretion system protein VirB10
MIDTNPNSLTQKPKFGITKYGKKPLYMALAGAVLLATILVASVQISTMKNKKSDRQSQPVNVREEDASILPIEAPAGLAKEKIKPQPLEQQESDSLINVIRPEPPSEEYLARKRELEQIRKYRRKAEFQALSSPMVVSVPASHNQMTSAPAQGQPTRTDSRGFQMSSMAQPIMSPVQGSSHYDQTERKDKEDFYERAERSKWELAHRRVPGALYELKTGAVIPGIMITGINSDLPGPITGQVSQDVYDTATGYHLLVPRGSRLSGLYDSRIVAGQERTLVAWNRLIFRDGSSITLGAMPGADMAGYAGFHGEVDNHYGKVFGNAVLMSLITGGAAYAMDSTTGGGSRENPSVLDSLGGAMASQLNQTTSTLLQQNSNIKPSLGIEPGYRFNIVVTKDMVFDKPYEPWR